MKRENLKGQTFGRLTVLEQAVSRKGRRMWKCICECENEVVVSTSRLKNGATSSCGCARKGINAVDITNKRFGQLVALYPTGKRLGNSIIWHCVCDCGEECDIALTNLRSNVTKSCGCLASAVRSETIYIAKKERDKHYVGGTDVMSLANNTIPKNNTSGTRGVHFDISVSLWKAQIIFKGTKYYLGGYNDKDRAIEARREAEQEMYGTFLEWYKDKYPASWKRIEQKRKGSKNEKI